MELKFSTPSVLLFALLAGNACNTLPQNLPEVRGKEVRVLHEGALAEVNPSDVAIEPISSGEGVSGVPNDRLRLAVSRALVRRRYSPLSMEYVDARVVDASYTVGSRGERAVCRVIVNEWDDSLWETHNAIRAAITVSIVNATDPDGDPLWQAEFSGRVDVRDKQRQMTDPLLRQEVLDELAVEVFSLMPARDTVPGQR